MMHDDSVVLYICNGMNKHCPRTAVCGERGSTPDNLRWCHHTTLRECAKHPELSPETHPDRFEMSATSDGRTRFWEKEKRHGN